MTIQPHEVDAQVETALQTKLRYGYKTSAVVVKSWIGQHKLSLGFFFEDGHNVGEISRRADGSHYEVLAVIC